MQKDKILILCKKKREFRGLERFLREMLSHASNFGYKNISLDGDGGRMVNRQKFLSAKARNAACSYSFATKLESIQGLRLIEAKK